MLLRRQVARTFGADAVDLLLRYQVRSLLSVGVTHIMEKWELEFVLVPIRHRQ